MTSTMHDRPPTSNGIHPEVRYWTKAGPVDSETLVADEISTIEERQEASMGEPAAMALFGFAVGTFIVAYPIAGFVPASTLAATIPPVLLFAGVAQFIGGLVAFRRNNAFAGTAFCAYGANNAVVAMFFLLQAGGTISAAPGSPAMQMLALEMYCFAVISLVLAVAATKLNLIFTLLLLALVPGFALPGIANWFGTGVDPFLGHLGGYFLIASAALAAYAAAAMVINSTWHAAVLSLVPLRRRMDPERLPRGREPRRAPAVPSQRPAPVQQPARQPVRPPRTQPTDDGSSHHDQP
jgi:succinate-acetate transporter protein